MKRLSFVCGMAVLSVLSPFSAWSAAVDAVVVWKSDGSKLVVMLEKLPRVVFSGRELLVQTLEGQIALPAGEVSRFTYESVTPSGVNGPSSGSVQISLLAGRLGFTGQKAGSQVELYGADGRQLQSATAGSDGTAAMDVSRFPSGTYIVKTSAGNFKINKP